MLDFWWAFWPYLVTIIYVAAGVPAAVHAVLTKREVRAAIGWVGLILVNPLLGALLYLLFGVNRIHRKAKTLRADLWQPPTPHADGPTREESVAQIRQQAGEHLATLVELVRKITGSPLLDGNRVEPLLQGDLAYPAMLSAIAAAEKSISLSSYIFDNDEAGGLFADALDLAVKRGVEVRVLVDSIGARYSRPSIDKRLRKAGVQAARFMPALRAGLIRFGNLRNHRKIMVVDGRIGFTGGMNIRAGHRLGHDPAHPVQDLHFRIEGPVVSQLQEVFSVDWSFTTGELLEGPKWFPAIESCDSALCRGIPDGPDDDFDHLRMTFLGALACARDSIKIVTPYFLPEEPLVDALNVAAMRGLSVDIVLPETNNLFYIHWATMATVGQVLEQGCRIWLSPPPFDHTKLMLADDIWSCFGSTNWDTRSLRLNFEFNVECYDRQLAAQLNTIADAKIAASRRLTIDEIKSRSLPTQLRDGVARLFLPYL